MRLRALCLIILLIILIPSFLYAETLILKDGNEIEVTHYWRTGDRIGYWQDGNEKYIGRDKVDWSATDAKNKPQSNSDSTSQKRRTVKKKQSSAPRHAHYTGRGDDVIRISKPAEGQAALLVIAGNRSNRHFSIKGYAESGERTGLLVNTSEFYNGTVLIDAGVRNTSQLEIKAIGGWVIDVYSLRYATKFSTPGAKSGDGDDVIIVSGDPKILEVFGNSSGRHFAIKAYSKSRGRTLLVNTSDPYHGKVRVPSKTFLLEVNAVGNWTLGAM